MSATSGRLMIRSVWHWFRFAVPAGLVATILVVSSVIFTREQTLRSVRNIDVQLVQSLITAWVEDGAPSPDALQRAFEPLGSAPGRPAKIGLAVLRNGVPHAANDPVMAGIDLEQARTLTTEGPVWAISDLDAAGEWQLVVRRRELAYDFDRWYSMLAVPAMQLADTKDGDVTWEVLWRKGKFPALITILVVFTLGAFGASFEYCLKRGQFARERELGAERGRAEADTQRAMRSLEALLASVSPLRDRFDRLDAAIELIESAPRDARSEEESVRFKAERDVLSRQIEELRFRHEGELATAQSLLQQAQEKETEISERQKEFERRSSDTEALRANLGKWQRTADRLQSLWTTDLSWKERPFREAEATRSPWIAPFSFTLAMIAIDRTLPKGEFINGRRQSIAERARADGLSQALVDRIERIWWARNRWVHEGELPDQKTIESALKVAGELHTTPPLPN